MNLTKKEARKFLLDYHYLRGAKQLSGKEGILKYIHQVGCIQFDPLDQVGYNSHLVLQSRIKKYNQAYLNELLYKDKQLIDFWDKNMSIYPVADLLYFRRYMTEKISNDLSALIIKKIKEIGKVCSSDFERKKKVNWWWGPTSEVRYTLEGMYHAGQLVVCDKKGSKKYYDLASNHRVAIIMKANKEFVSDVKFYQWVIKRRIGSVGMLWNKQSDAYLGIKKLKSDDRKKAFSYLLKNNEIIEIKVDGIDEILYIRSEDKDILSNSLNDQSKSKRVNFIAPLDNMMWDRKLIKVLFDFEYKWEVYTPEKERKYGYYVLPVLYKDQFVARIEVKYIKKTKTLEINNWWWEDQIIETAIFEKNLTRCINDFLYYLQGENIVYNVNIVSLR